MVLVLLLLSSLLIQTSIQVETCAIHEDANLVIESLEPIFLTTDYAFLYPKLENAYNATVYIEVGDSIIISCPGGDLTGRRIPLNRTVIATCSNHSLLEIDEYRFGLKQILCNSTSFSLASIREVDGSSCGVNGTGTLIDIGFDVEIDDQFVYQSSVCFDKQELMAQYVYHNLTPYLQYSMLQLVTDIFDQDVYYQDMNLRDLYNASSQRHHLNPLLGLPEDSDYYFPDGASIEAAALTESSSFLYSNQQKAAYRYINSAPVWSRLIYGNWGSIQRDIRQFSINYGLNLDVYSGPHGVLTLPHNETGELVEIYLHQDDNSKVLAVPEILWIVAYEPNTKKAVAAVLHNNPYIDVESVDKVCEDISEDVNWMTWDFPNEVARGYVYVCSYDDLKAAVEEVPQLEVNGILH